jgi:hypothetical protein
MIRRGFWLAVGAAGGIMGYRRVSSIGRQLSATLSPAGPRGDAGHAEGGEHRSRAVHHGAGRAGATLSGAAGRGLLRGTVRFTRDARMFSRDVREGMDLYLVRHRAQGSPTLGAGARSRRSPAPPPVVEVPGAPTAHDERVKDDR